MKLCFDCLNSTSGMCHKHTQNLEKKYATTTLNISITKDDIIESLEMQKEQLIKEVKKAKKCL